MQLKKFNLLRGDDGALLLCHHQVHPHLLHHCLVRSHPEHKLFDPLPSGSRLQSIQNLTPQEQFLPPCTWPHKQGQRPPLTLTPPPSTHYINVYHLLHVLSTQYLYQYLYILVSLSLLLTVLIYCFYFIIRKTKHQHTSTYSLYV